MTKDKLQEFYESQFKELFETLAEKVHEFSPISVLVVIETASHQYLVMPYPPSRALAKGLSDEVYNIFWVENDGQGDVGEVRQEGEQFSEDADDEDVVEDVVVEDGLMKRSLRRKMKIN